MRVPVPMQASEVGLGLELEAQASEAMQELDLAPDLAAASVLAPAPMVAVGAKTRAAPDGAGVGAAFGMKKRHTSMAAMKTY